MRHKTKARMLSSKKNAMNTRVEVWRRIFVRNAVTKKQYSSRISYIFLRWMRWNAVNYAFSPRSRHIRSKRNIPTRVRSSHLQHAFKFLFHCANFHAIQWHFFWNKIRFNRRLKTYTVHFCKKCHRHHHHQHHRLFIHFFHQTQKCTVPY